MTETISYLDYELCDGYIHNWLVLGPQTVVLEESEGGGATPEDVTTDSSEVVRISATAVEPMAPAADVAEIDGFSGQWRYVRCLEDHLVTLPHMVDESHRMGPALLRCWAYTELSLDTVASEVDESGISFLFTLSALGAADVWINAQHVTGVWASGQRPESSSFPVTLHGGRNRILIRFGSVSEAAYRGEGPRCAIALQVAASASHGNPEVETSLPQVLIPTRISRLPRRKWLEDVFESAVLPQYVFGRQDQVRVLWPDEHGGFPRDARRAEPENPVLTTIDLPPDPQMEDEAGDDGNGAVKQSEPPPVGITGLSIRLQKPEGRVYGEGNPDVKAGSVAELGFTYRYPDGPLAAVLMPRPKEYYQGNMRITRSLRFWSLDNNPYRDAPTSDYAERRSQTLVRAAQREANIYSEVAKMAIGWWSKLEPGLVAAAVEQLKTRDSRVYRDAVGLLGMVIRFGDVPEFPEGVAADLRSALPALVFFDELPLMKREVASEAVELLSAVCEILAGQIAPEMIFAATGQTGTWHRERGERTALTLMRRMGTRGLHGWGSDLVIEEIFLALAHIVDFVDDDAVWDLAMVLMDKMLFTLATNSYKGIYGPARASTETASVLGGYLGATSGISKLMWGMGIDTPHIRAAVSLACMEDYELPVLLDRIAGDLDGTEMWSLETDAPADLGVTRASYRTAGGLLSSAQDYRPGELGDTEHVWQATLGAGATVFVNHPVRADLEDAGGPNFWRGNGVLPRVAQWQDALIALYRLPEDDWMGFTHAYFPIHAFDEVALRDGWAFARKGEGYLALWASRGLALIESGPSANRELRSYGAENVWLCQMGRLELDGDFAAFQEKVLALSVEVGPLTGDGARWTTLRGDALRLNWIDPLVRNGAVVDYDDDTHINNAYCVAPLPASTMDIRYGDVAMRLDFAPQDTQDDGDL